MPLKENHQANILQYPFTTHNYTWMHQSHWKWEIAICRKTEDLKEMHPDYWFILIYFSKSFCLRQKGSAERWIGIWNKETQEKYNIVKFLRKIKLMIIENA